MRIITTLYQRIVNIRRIKGFEEFLHSEKIFFLITTIDNQAAVKQIMDYRIQQCRFYLFKIFLFFQNIISQRCHIHTVFDVFISSCHRRILVIYSIRIQKFLEQNDFFRLSINLIKIRQILVNKAFLELHSEFFQKFRTINFIPNRNVNLCYKIDRILVSKRFFGKFVVKTFKCKISIVLISFDFIVKNFRLTHHHIGILRLFIHFFKHIKVNKIVRINKSDIFPRNALECYVSCSRLSGSFIKIDNLYPLIFFSKILQNLERFILRIIVNTNNLNVLKRLIYKRIQTFFKIQIGIINRGDYRNFRGFFLSHYLPPIHQFLLAISQFFPHNRP